MGVGLNVTPHPPFAPQIVPLLPQEKAYLMVQLRYSEEGFYDQLVFSKEQTNVKSRYVIFFTEPFFGAAALSLSVSLPS